jgi:hypothetical protein
LAESTPIATVRRFPPGDLIAVHEYSICTANPAACLSLPDLRRQRFCDEAGTNELALKAQAYDRREVAGILAGGLKAFT